MIEIYEIHSLGVTTGLEINRSENSQIGAIRGLLDWQIEDNSEIDRYLQEIDVSTAYHETKGTVWWLIEIADPPILRSNMVDWLEDPVYYAFYTKLNKKEVEKIVLSLIANCSNK